MQHQTTINELATIQGLFSTVDHITVPETNRTGITEEVTLPPPLIRRTTRRDDSVVWVLTPPGVHERITVADGATITVYFKDIDSGRFTGYVPPQQQAQAAPQQQTTWQPAQQQAPAPTHYPAQQPAAPQRPAAPWTNPPQG